MRNTFLFAWSWILITSNELSKFMISGIIGDSDVGKLMMLSDLRCWWKNHYLDDLFSLCWWFIQCIKSATNILNLSPTHFISNIRLQHRYHRYHRRSWTSNFKNDGRWLVTFTDETFSINWYWWRVWFILSPTW